MAKTTDTRERLIHAAIELIYGRSFGAVGVQEICARADVQKGSFYHFFRSKRELAIAAIDELWRRLQRQVFDPAFSEEIPPLQRIERFFEHSATFQAAWADATGHVPGCPLGNLALEMSTQDEALREHIARLFTAAERRIEQALEAARADGSAPDIDPPAAARALFAYMEGALLMAKTRNDPEIVRNLGRPAMDLITAPAPVSEPAA
jgi:TetR/AcrR family transcriptional repressor of nem operon